MSFFRLQMKQTFMNLKTWLMILVMVFVIPYVVIMLSTVEDDGYIYHLALMDDDKTKLSQDFYESIKNSAGMTIVEGITYDEALRELNLGNLDIIYIIKEGFEEKITAGNYRDVIRWTQSAETVSTSWMNDQLSVGVIRYWLKTDIVKRIQEVDESFTFDRFAEEFDQNFEENQLIDHKVIEIVGDDLKLVQEKPLINVYFFNIWGIFILIWVWLQNRIIIDDLSHNIISRMKMTEGNSLSYYATRYIILTILLFIPWISTYIYLDELALGYTRALSLIPYTAILFVLSIGMAIVLKSKKSYTMVGYVFILLNVIFSSDLVSDLLSSSNIIQKLMPLYWFVN